MEFNRAGFGALAVLAVVAAGGGAYLANMENAPASADMQQMHSAEVPGTVTETENSVAPVQPVTTPSEAPGAIEPVEMRPAAPAPSARRNSAPVRSTGPVANRARTSPASPSLPSSSPSSAPFDPPVAAAIEPAASATVEHFPVPSEPPAAPRKVYEELIVPADSVIGLQVENTVTTEQAKVEDPVRARVTRDVKVGGEVAIPAGARAEGSITVVERGSRLKDHARLGIRFHTIVLADGTRLPISTETIYREGESPARESAAKIGGGAVGGAVLGAILGGKKGAIIGSTVGAGAGGAAVAVSEPNAATLPAGSTVTVRVSSPATVTVEK
jgi:hypothetical protein